MKKSAQAAEAGKLVVVCTSHFSDFFKICVLIKDYFLFLSIRQLATQLYIIIIIMWQKF